MGIRGRWIQADTYEMNLAAIGEGESFEYLEGGISSLYLLV